MPIKRELSVLPARRLGSIVQLLSPSPALRASNSVTAAGCGSQKTCRLRLPFGNALLWLATFALGVAGCATSPRRETGVCQCPAAVSQPVVKATRDRDVFAANVPLRAVAAANAAYNLESDSAVRDTADGNRANATGEPVERRLPSPDVDYLHDHFWIAEPTITLVDVVASIHSTFPLLQAAIQETTIAEGNQMASWGAFDAKFKTATEGGPLGFYETFRSSAGLSQPIFRGGEVFGGYRVGRGDFQPWYLERQTNDGGEFKAEARVPLVRNREIDARRAGVWRAEYDQQIVQPEIRAQLIQFVREGSNAYWMWVAAGQQYMIGERALILAEQRAAQLKRRVEIGDMDPPVLQDNLRAIASREAKLIALRRKRQQAAVKLSLFYRSLEGCPIVPPSSQLAIFPEPAAVSDDQFEFDVVSALAQRPELTALELLAQRVNVDLAEARNDMLPTVDARIVGSQDTGAAASKKRDKSQFELEVGIFVDVPIQRRKARGKTLAATGKLAQISAKRQFTEDKIAAELRSAHLALAAAFERLDKARESKRLAEYMAAVERRKFELGESSLLSVVLREQHAIEAAESEVEALLEYFTARTDYDAAMAN